MFLKWNKRGKGQEMCTGSGAMPRGVAKCGERHETVSSSNAARARARHYKQLAPLRRRQEARPIRPCGTRSAFDQQIWRGELQWKPNTSPTKTKRSPTENQVLTNKNQALTNKNQVVTKSLPSSYQLITKPWLTSNLGQRMYTIGTSI